MGWVAAHALHRLDRPMTSAVGAMLVVAGHAHGWVVAEGGSSDWRYSPSCSSTAAGSNRSSRQPVGDLPPFDVLMLDVSPSGVRRFGRPLPRRARAYGSSGHGPGVQSDFAVEDDSWTSSDARKAGTVHVGGDIEEVAAAELGLCTKDVCQTGHSFCWAAVSFDPSRSVGAVHPWTYAHVPHGFTGDATQAIVSQIERFAPGSATGQALPSVDDRDVAVQRELRWRHHRRCLDPKAANFQAPGRL